MSAKQQRAASARWSVSVDTPWVQGHVGSKKNRSITMAPSDGPKFQANTRQRSYRQTIAQRELIATVSASSTFQCTSWQVQPGLASFLPWLAQIAKLYQRYKILSMTIEYIPTVTEYDPLGQRGRVVLCFDSDAVSPLLTSMQQAESTAPFTPGRSMDYLKLALPNDGASRFTRSGPAPAGTYLKTYDAGVLYWNTDGFSGSGVVGEIHAHYEVELFAPILPNAVSAPVNHLFTGYYTNGPSPLVTGVNLILPTVNLASAGNGLGTTDDGAGTITLPAGLFRLTLIVKYTCSAANLTYIMWAIQKNGAAFGFSQLQRSWTAAVSHQCECLTTVTTASAGDTIRAVVNTTLASGTVNAEGYLMIQAV